MYALRSSDTKCQLWYFSLLRYEFITVPCFSWLIPFPVDLGFHIFFTTYAQESHSKATGPLECVSAAGEGCTQVCNPAVRLGALPADG